MVPQSLIQIIKDRVDIDNQINETQTKIAIDCLAGECRATVAYEIEGQIKLFEINCRELGMVEHLS